MSSKGILRRTRNESGRIEGVRKKKLAETLSIFRNGDYSLHTPDSVTPDSNQDVAEECRNGENIASSVLEIASSSNFILSSSRITSDVGVSVDDWFKSKTDGTMDLDSVLTTDAMEVSDLEEYDFSSKENVDMCVVTNVCDMGLGFDFPVIICEKCNHNVDECGCDKKRVGKLKTTSFLDDFDSEDEDRSMLIKVEYPKLSKKQKTLTDKEKDIADSYIVQIQEKDEKSSCSKDSDWSQNDVVYKHSQSVILNGENVSCGSLSSASHQGSDFDSEKDVDFSQFSLLTFQVENAEGVNVINTLSQIESVSENDVPNSVIVTESSFLPNNVSLMETTGPKHIKAGRLSKVHRDNCEVIGSLIQTNNTEVTECNALDLRKEPPSFLEALAAREKVNNSMFSKITTSTNYQLINPRSLLRPTQRVAPLKFGIKQPSSLGSNPKTSGPVRRESENSASLNGTKKTPSMTIIAISTDKSKNTTEIVINTSQGEQQKFRGKTSDFLKATSKLFANPQSPTKTAPKLSQSSVDDKKEESVASQTENETEWVKYQKSKAADEQPITEALEELGIDVSSLVFVTSGGVNGDKLWTCPVSDCAKGFPRLSVLKVHILTHYGVRPYRCDVPGCHWTFYTFLKLKRHKETHLKRKAFVCPVPSCGHRFTTIYNLKTHRKLHERPAKLQCPVEGCDAHFQTKRAVELHIKKHGISHAPYHCTFPGCGKRYFSSNTLNSHARSHQHKEEEIRCQWPDCGKWFNKPCRLKAHMRMHTGDKPHLCTFENCRWAFSSASKLKRHQQKHTNERKFLCLFEGCGKSFMRSEHLKEHMQTHIGERSYQCTVENCGVKFTAKSSLYVHLKKHKQQLEQVSLCPSVQEKHVTLPANKGSASSDRLLGAMWKASESGDGSRTASTAGAESVFPCPVESCSKVYSSKASLRQHLLKHHTPVLASDANQLGYVTSLLLSGNSNQQALDISSRRQQMRTANSLPTFTETVSGVGDLNTTDLLATNSLFDCVPEFINTDLLNAPHIQNMLVVTQGSSHEDESTNGATLILPSESLSAAEADAELHLATESISQHMIAAEYEREAFNMNEIQAPIEHVATDDPTCQAARTNLTYQDVVLRKETQNATSVVEKKTVNSVRDSAAVATSNSNVTLRVPESTLGDSLVGLRDPVTTLCLPPDMAGLLSQSSDLNLLLQEETGLQVLLLEGGEPQFYTESTINLRDLE